MASTGTYTELSSLTIAQLIDESFRRLRVDPILLTTEHQFSARLSLTLLFADWANEGNHQFTIETTTQALVVGDISFIMPVGSIDVLDMIYSFNDQDIQIKAISREDYLYINNKESAGQPVCYFVDKTTIPPVVKLWPVPNTVGSLVSYNRMIQIQDVGQGTNTPGVTRMYVEAICAGLAAKLAEKYGDVAQYPTMEKDLLVKAASAYKRASDQDRDRAPYVIKPRLGRRGYYGI